MNSTSNKSFVARTFIISFIFIPFEGSTHCHRFFHQSHRQVERSQCTAQDRHLGSKYRRMKRKYLANNFTPQKHKVRLSHAFALAICCSTKTKVCADERKKTKEEGKKFLYSLDVKITRFTFTVVCFCNGIGRCTSSLDIE